jgi:hypothetical protein
MPSRCDFANLFRVVTSDWHPRLLHDVALRLNGRQGLDGIDGDKANARSVSSQVRARARIAGFELLPRATASADVGY